MNSFIGDTLFFYDKLTELTNPFIDYFDDNIVKKLNKIWDENHGIAIALNKIKSAGLVYVENKQTYFFYLKVKEGKKLSTYWFETLSKEDDYWACNWIEYISTGTLLYGITINIEKTSKLSLY